MSRSFAAFFATVLLAGCSVSIDGHCNNDADCTAPATCDLKRNACALPCEPKCGVGELCINRACVQQGPVVKNVVAPTTWSKRSGTLTVTATVDDGQGPGTASAALHIAGQQDIAGTSADSLTWSFAVPATVQAAGRETPVAFTIDAIDKAGHATLSDAIGTGQLLIDDNGPSLPSGVTVNGGVTAGGIQWFPNTGANIDVQTVIADPGSGVKQDTLTLMDGGTRLDTGTPTCSGAPNSITCHFAVPRATVAAGSQRKIQFAVAGTDVAGNPLRTNTAALGIDAKAPAITFTVGDAASTATTKYPALNADCGAPLDSTLFCGHDGTHFWRAEDGKYKITFTVSDSFAVPDDVGSGADPAGGTCTVAGSTTICTVTFDAGTGSFSFPADFATATFASAADGTGTVTVSVNAKDLVGNTLASAVSLPIQITRVKWMRQTLSLPIAGAPIHSSLLNAVIVAGTNGTADPILAFGTGATNAGAILWSTGNGLTPKITTVTTNMALDTTASTDVAHPTPILYVNSGGSLYAMHVAVTGIDKYCTATIVGLIGAPVIFGGGANAEAIVAGNTQLRAVSTAALSSTGGGCSVDNLFAFGATTHPKLGPPSAKGSTIFLGYDNTANTANDLGIASVDFSGGSAGTFSAPNSVNLGFQPTSNPGLAAISPASDLFFGNDFNHKFYDFTTALTAGPVSPALTSNIFTQPTVSGGLVFGMTNQLIAYSAANIANISWTSLSNVTQVTPPAVGVGTLYLSEAGTPQIHAIDSVTGTTTRSDRWTYAGAAGTVPPTNISSITTEPTLASDGTLYFGDNAGRVYAIITDTPPVATGASDWPRTGYDNCNSNHAANTGYTCQ